MNKSKLITWLLTVTLIISTLSFGDNAGRAPLQQNRTPRTALVKRSTRSSLRHTVSYSKALFLTNSNKYFTRSIDANIAMAHTLLAEVKYNLQRWRNSTYLGSHCLELLKSIPLYAEEDSFFIS